MFIAMPNKEYHGLFVELKKVGTRLKKKNGQYATKHIKEQAEMIEKLNTAGYYAAFAVGFDEAKKIIDNYLLSCNEDYALSNLS